MHFELCFTLHDCYHCWCTNFHMYFLWTAFLTRVNEPTSTTTAIYVCKGGVYGVVQFLILINKSCGMWNSVCPLFYHWLRRQLRSIYLDQRLVIISMAWCKTAVFPLLMQWGYCSLALSHQYVNTMTADGQSTQGARASADMILSSFPSLQLVTKENVFFLFIPTTGSHTLNWRYRSGSTLAQLIACFQTAHSHYLNQCVLISEVLWHHSLRAISLQVDMLLFCMCSVAIL